MISIWINLPKDILNKILDYDDIIKYENGKYINKISKSDERYTIVNSVNRNVDYLLSNYSYLKVNEHFNIYIIEYDQRHSSDNESVRRKVVKYIYNFYKKNKYERFYCYGHLVK
jgi:hypothetical protein